MDKMFICPKCGGSRYRTCHAMHLAEGSQRQCKEIGCGFVWHPSQDEQVFVIPVSIARMRELGAMIKDVGVQVSGLGKEHNDFGVQCHKAWAAVRGRMVYMILSSEERAGFDWLDQQFGGE